VIVPLTSSSVPGVVVPMPTLFVVVFTNKVFVSTIRSPLTPKSPSTAVSPPSHVSPITVKSLLGVVVPIPSLELVLSQNKSLFPLTVLGVVVQNVICPGCTSPSWYSPLTESSTSVNGFHSALP